MEGSSHAAPAQRGCLQLKKSRKRMFSVILLGEAKAIDGGHQSWEIMKVLGSAGSSTVKDCLNRLPQGAGLLVQAQLLMQQTDQMWVSGRS